jgi:hypothetical protein
MTIADPAVSTGTPVPVQLRTRRDHSLTVQALEARAKGLDTLAKRNADEGYTRESKTQAADAAAIRTFILPAFYSQRELPLVGTDQVRAGIVEALRFAVRGELVVVAPKDRQEDLLRDREQQLLERLAVHIETFAVAVAEDAYAAGVAAREDQPAAIAHRQLSTLTIVG